MKRIEDEAHRHCPLIEGNVMKDSIAVGEIHGFGGAIFANCAKSDLIG